MQFSVLLSLRVTQSTCTPECSHDLLLRHACSLVLELWCCRAAGTFNVAVSVARCAIFPPKFATFLFVWWVKFAFGGWRIFWLFSQYVGGKFGGFL